MQDIQVFNDRLVVVVMILSAPAALIQRYGVIHHLFRFRPLNGEYPLDALPVDDLYLGVWAPLETIDYSLEAFLLVGHHPARYLVEDLLGKDLSDDKAFLLLLDIKVFQEVRGHIEGVLGTVGELGRQIGQALHQLPGAVGTALGFWDAFVDVGSLEEESLIHVLGILTKIQVLKLPFPVGVDEAGNFFDLSFVDDLYQFESMIGFIKTAWKGNLVFHGL